MTVERFNQSVHKGDIYYTTNMYIGLNPRTAKTASNVY